jgi:ketosteroid isomerase-like protein
VDFFDGYSRANHTIGQPVCVRTPLPPVATVIGFVDAINHGDVARLAALMTTDHRLQVLDEEALVGRAANVNAWRAYAIAFPDYVIYPQRIVAREADVVVLGHTTGSHLGLPDDEESVIAVIWRAEVDDGRLTLWQIIEDSPARRAELGLTDR